MDEEYAESILGRSREGVSLNYNETSLEPVGIAVILVLGLCVFLLPRKYAIVPILLLACLVPAGQRLVILTLDFTPLRIMVVIGWLRMFMRNEISDFRWKSIDTFIVLWALCGAVAYTALHGTFSALIYKMGGIFDVVGMYIIFRVLVISWEDVYRIAHVLALISIPLGLLFLIEHQTGRNLFGTLGGVPEITKIREGRLRCQGAYVHPIAAGCFWASCVPLIVASYLKNGKNRLVGMAAIASAVMIVIFSASSTPLAAVLAGVAVLGMFSFRHWMKYIKWGGVLGLVLLHLLMTGPVWALIAKVDIVGGSTGYHRYNLIDNTIRRFDEWWLVGTKSTAHWGYYLFDLANQYVAEAVRGGIFNFVLFVVVILMTFGTVGFLYKAYEGKEKREFFAWTLGSTFFVHCVSFIALHYSQQILMIWLLNIAMIVSLKPAVVSVERTVEDGDFLTENPSRISC